MARSSSTEFFGSQVGGDGVINYAYTDMPGRLLVRDIYYFFVYSWSLPLLLTPMFAYGSDGLDELWPNWPNMLSLAAQLLLVGMQLFFVLALLPLTVLLPIWVAAAVVLAFLALNWAICWLLNGSSILLDSDPEYASARPEHAHEQWLFLNGVAAGKHWTKSNLNRLALTFGRPIKGVHNGTSGIIFDIVECLVQRNFTYATADVRLCFKVLRDVLYDPAKSKVVFIVHSQGGIEGGLVIDWLLQEMPQDLLAKLEVYTFGNAANHFNNPHRHVLSQELTQSGPRAALDTLVTESSVATPAEAEAGGGGGGGGGGYFARDRQSRSRSPSSSRTLPAAEDRAIGHIEHYAHSTDFVALWGVLHFSTNRMASPQLPRFMGRVFKRSSGRGGHLFNQHYLDGMFPLARDPRTGALVGADERNDFMEEPVRVGDEGDAMHGQREAIELAYAVTLGPAAARRALRKKHVRVKDLSRLWGYRNGRSPPDKTPSPLLADGVVRTATPA
ncbi:hypothetical protein CDD83_2278 [Cordyceps sp. RAO-2017]|nr:hypothetical protein CDD83_2278 [Cordyceps sp. RAO-2017]